MITIQKATPEHADGIAKVCIDSYWATYGELLSSEYINRMIKEFYTRERIIKEVTTTSKGWNGWFVAVDDEEVVGAGAGGMISENHGELFVLYLDPERKGEGLGTKLLDAVTNELKEYGAKEQWVSVTKWNNKGIPFYEAKGFIYIHEQDEYGIIEGEDYQALRYHRVL
ncbi:GNAT superfamily N-acetyltransferase [Virgibacillus natechei]|uniref:GNAT superfamily N-acetyltransferase n=1 Tax=Virgibacillus natechei TaxID=1216297 RepID=A0ABS4IHV4_9BACI|nr:GNAT family N-acetyltransferase [Virgibacillus natechei]MBP1970532.1 GNAT superfamily N-acetyltransferase [Virgibacillus natechei]UZD14065.1 GNAT family N-acetyltransferase [Virgibacillus natechei]